MPAPKFRPAVPTEDLRSYLTAVYPEALQLLNKLGRRQLVHRYESLDYYYSASLLALEGLRPPLDVQADADAQAPYIPAGAYYRAAGAAPLDYGRLNAVLWGRYDRHDRPVEVLSRALHGSQVASFHSSFGARMGPQPSWTSPLVIVRYIHHPNGLQRASAPLPSTSSSLASPSALNSTLRVRPLKARVDSLGSTFNLANVSLPARLSPSDGDLLEVEQWGGLLGADECPPICGLWANVWRGTGVSLRVSRPYSSANKATALVELLDELGARNASALEDLVTVLNAREGVEQLRTRSITASGQTSLASLLAWQMLADLPCTAAHRDPHFVAVAKQWERLLRTTPPGAVASLVRGLGSDSALPPAFTAAARFALVRLPTE